MTDAATPDAATPPPDADALHQAALSYLARFAATRAGLRRVLDRRIERWARGHPDPDAAALAAAYAAAETVVERMVRTGAVDDAAFAQARARSLLRAGKSARSVQGRLLGKGLAPELARGAAATDPETELAAALVLTRRRRIGAYRPGGRPDAAGLARELGVLARAGFGRDVAQRALDVAPEDAEQRIRELRR